MFNCDAIMVSKLNVWKGFFLTICLNKPLLTLNTILIYSGISISRHLVLNKTLSSCVATEGFLKTAQELIHTLYSKHVYHYREIQESSTSTISLIRNDIITLC